MNSIKAQTAFEHMSTRKMNCAQSVFTAFAGDYGLDRVMALRLSQGFGGGMGHTGGYCGAVTGAYLALGLAQDLTGDNPREKIEKTYALIAEFNRRFNALHGSLNCTELTGYDLGILENLLEAREKGVFATKCPNYVKDAVAITEELLKNAGLQ